jgi:hypothetical protein
MNEKYSNKSFWGGVLARGSQNTNFRRIRVFSLFHLKKFKFDATVSLQRRLIWHKQKSQVTVQARKMEVIKGSDDGVYFHRPVF